MRSKVLWIIIVLYPLILFGQTIPLPDPTTPTVTITTDTNGATNPAAWATLAKEIGPAMFFAVICLTAFFALVVGLGWVGYKFGGKLLDRLDKFFDGIQTSTTGNAEILKSQVVVGNITRSNVQNLVDAGHNFANAVQKIGKEIGVNVDEDCEKIHEKLRTILSTN